MDDRAHSLICSLLLNQVGGAPVILGDTLWIGKEVSEASSQKAENKTLCGFFWKGTEILSTLRVTASPLGWAFT